MNIKKQLLVFVLALNFTCLSQVIKLQQIFTKFHSARVVQKRQFTYTLQEKFCKKSVPITPQIVQKRSFNCSPQVMNFKEMRIKLPSAEILQERLNDMGLEYFREKTELHQQLGNKTLHPMGVAVAVELALADMSKIVKMPMMDELLQMCKSEIIETILKDDPEAIAELKKTGILK